MNSDGKKTGTARRVLSWTALILIALCAAGLIISAFMHADKGIILSFLFVLMAVPFVFFACITYLKHKEEFLKDRMQRKEDSTQKKIDIEH